MSAHDNGGPAFPTTPDCYDQMDPAGAGMTLRDYFAAKVIAALWANNEILRQTPGTNEAAALASIAYEQADAMLKERAK